MNEHREPHLDGDVPSQEQAPQSDGRASDWDRMVASFRSAAPSAPAPPWLEDRVMAEIGSLPRHGPVRRAVRWLVSPAPLRVSPLSAGLVAAAIALAILLPKAATEPTTTAAEVGAGVDREPVVYVQFLLDAPDATSVAVAGDFSGWEPTFALADPDGDGIWSARVPIRPGVHGYMFVIDETRWLTDPNAERYQEDGFGNRNAVLAVGARS